MVFTYFKRAKFYLNEYTRINFYLALYLASDIEEDIDEYKYEIFPWALGTRWRTKFGGFLRKRDVLLRRIGYRAIVSRKCCEEVQSLVPDHPIWKRERAEDHGGATRAYLINKSRRLLNFNSSNKNNNEEEDLNLPRGPHEIAKQCSLCLINRQNKE
jgi:speedy